MPKRKQISLTLPPDLLDLINNKAEQLGLTRNNYIIQTMNSLLRFEQNIMDRIDEDTFKSIIHSAVKSLKK